MGVTAVVPAVAVGLIVPGLRVASDPEVPRPVGSLVWDA